MIVSTKDKGEIRCGGFALVVAVSFLSSLLMTISWSMASDLKEIRGLKTAKPPQILTPESSTQPVQPLESIHQKPNEIPATTASTTTTTSTTTTAATTTTPPVVQNRERTAPQPNENPYCNPTPIGEKQQWNPRKKVISIVLYKPAGEAQMPVWLDKGVEITSREAKLYFPDWVIRLYTVGLQEAYIQRLVSIYDNIEVVTCDQDSPLKSLGVTARLMYTRFLAIDDPTVDVVIVRDLDSRFSPRELFAVNEWLSSDLKFHTMRDHPFHTVPVMGGMFGMKQGLFDHKLLMPGRTPTMAKLIQQALEEHPNSAVPGCCGDDQNFLTTYVWSRIKHTAMDHDMNPSRCKRYGARMCRPFPLGPRNDETRFFVGAPFKRENWNATYDCTLQCAAKF